MKKTLPFKTIKKNCYNGSHLRSFHKLSHPFVFLTWMIYNIIKFVEERCAVTFQAYDFHLTDDTKGIKSYRLKLKEILVCLCSFADIQNEGASVSVWLYMCVRMCVCGWAFIGHVCPHQTREDSMCPPSHQGDIGHHSGGKYSALVIFYIVICSIDKWLYFILYYTVYKMSRCVFIELNASILNQNAFFKSYFCTWFIVKSVFLFLPAESNGSRCVSSCLWASQG